MYKILGIILTLLSINTFALERKSLTDISVSELTSDTQAQPESAEDKHFSLVWWVPFEYWASVFARDANIPQPTREEMLKVLQKYTVVAVVQADISTLGTFNFYSKEEVLKALKFNYKGKGGQDLALSPEKNISGDMQILMQQIAPVLQAAMGNMGANFHFFVYRDSNDIGERLIDPYKEGIVSVSLSNRDSKALNVKFETPLNFNSLYVPRTCPNGKKAHVSWSYCPWSGAKI